MAEASIVQTYVEKLVVEQVEGVKLILTKEEALILAVVLGHVGGLRDNSPRNRVEAVLKALEEVVGDWYVSDENKLLNTNDALIFNRYENHEE